MVDRRKRLHQTSRQTFSRTGPAWQLPRFRLCLSSSACPWSVPRSPRSPPAARPPAPSAPCGLRSPYPSAYSTACLLPADLPHAWASSNAASPSRDRHPARSASPGGSRGTYACSQPLPLASSQRARRSDQAHGPLRLVPLPGHARHGLEVVAGARLVPGPGRQRQALLQVCPSAPIGSLWARPASARS